MFSCLPVRDEPRVELEPRCRPAERGCRDRLQDGVGIALERSRKRGLGAGDRARREDARQYQGLGRDVRQSLLDWLGVDDGGPQRHHLEDRGGLVRRSSHIEQVRERRRQLAQELRFRRHELRGREGQAHLVGDEGSDHGGLQGGEAPEQTGGRKSVLSTGVSLAHPR